ncbi:hypothetical protein AJ79_07148 [Helicocarpus griseus UAMH5409]|uniref:Uncharacterized protein n=1 Tax=Helicocarpus griseus UAMH5409 TaxID=1447875 RepID=A0A2B7X6A8_9EURO|nr:hypothetical protein AJ79_07148 [Helicocarpus griseus UAMH5409]
MEARRSEASLLNKKYQYDHSCKVINYHVTKKGLPVETGEAILAAMKLTDDITRIYHQICDHSTSYYQDDDPFFVNVRLEVIKDAEPIFFSKLPFVEFPRPRDRIIEDEKSAWEYCYTTIEGYYNGDKFVLRYSKPVPSKFTDPVEERIKVYDWLFKWIFANPTGDTRNFGPLCSSNPKSEPQNPATES